MRTITLTYDSEYGSWPFRASTEMAGAPKTLHGPEGVLWAGGPTEAYAIDNLRRVVGLFIDPQGPSDYPKTIEVHW